MNLEELIHKKEAVLQRDNKLNAKKNHKSKAQLARDAKKYRQSHKQKLKNQRKQAAAKSGGHKHPGKKNQQPDSKKSIADLKALATKVKGQLAVAKQKLAAL
jgi:hypothetical protein